MTAAFRPRIPISVYAARVILWYRGTMPAGNSRWPGARLVTPARHRGLSRQHVVFAATRSAGCAGFIRAITGITRNRGSAMATIAALIGGIGAGGPVLRRPGARPAAGINRPGPCHPAHAPVRGGNGPAGRPDLAGSSAAGQPQPGASRRAREQPVKMSRHSPEVSQVLRFLESVKARV